MRRLAVELDRDDPVIVLVTTRTRERKVRGKIVSVAPKHCLVDLGKWKESFPYDRVWKVLDGGTVVPVLQPLSKSQIDRVLNERDRQKGIDVESLIEDLKVEEDGKAPEWLQIIKPREVEEEMPDIDPAKLDEFVQRYKNRERVNDICQAMGLNVNQLAKYVNYADEHGLIVKRSRSWRRNRDGTGTEQVRSKGADSKMERVENGTTAHPPAVKGDGVPTAPPSEKFDVKSLSDDQLRRLAGEIREEAAERFLKGA